MDEDRKHYILNAIWNLRDATNLVEDEFYQSSQTVAQQLYKGGFISDEEYDEIGTHLDEMDDYCAKRERGEVDLEQERREWVDNVVGRLCGCSSGVARDAIIKYCKLPDLYWKDKDIIKQSL
jgi:argininosuccinate lyase